MRLRELKFPIAILEPNSLMGGRSAGLDTVRRFNFNVADFYKKGGFDQAIIYDAMGREFTVDQIELSHPHWVRFFLRRAGNLFIFPDRDKTDMVAVDMALTQTRKLTLEQFKEELLEIALRNPTWWQRHSDRREIESMFKGCNTIADTIEDIGVLDASGKEKLKGISQKTLDLR